jgi:hypothetical protein
MSKRTKNKRKRDAIRKRKQAHSANRRRQFQALERINAPVRLEDAITSQLYTASYYAEEGMTNKSILECCPSINEELIEKATKIRKAHNKAVEKGEIKGKKNALSREDFRDLARTEVVRQLGGFDMPASAPVAPAPEPVEQVEEEEGVVKKAKKAFTNFFGRFRKGSDRHSLKNAPRK